MQECLWGIFLHLHESAFQRVHEVPDRLIHHFTFPPFRSAASDVEGGVKVQRAAGQKRSSYPKERPAYSPHSSGCQSS
jgi:hypothetical protein